MLSQEKKIPFYLGNFRTGNIIRQPEYCDPVGPSFAKAKRWKISIEGTQVTFSAPKHKPVEKTDEPKYPRPKYLYENMVFRDIYREGLMLKNDWEFISIFHNTWAFHGPFLTGPLADISSSLIVLRNKDKKPNTSYFHPRVFEHTVADFLTNRYSMHKQNGRHEYIAPVSWKPLSGLSIPAVYLKVISNDEVKLYEEMNYCFFVLDDRHIAYFSFKMNRGVFYAVTKADLDKRVGDKNMHELVDNVIDSLRVTLSPAAKAQQQKALEGLDDTSLTKTFPPLKWDRDAETYNETQRKLTAK